MINIIKKYWVILLLLVLGAALLIYLLNLKGCSDDNGGDEPVIVSNAAIQPNYEKDLTKDTVDRWHELTKTIRKADTIYIYKVDTVFIERVKNYDLILQVKKEKDYLRIRAVNINGMLIKEMVYRDIGRDFVISSVDNGVVVKKENFYLNGIKLFGNAAYPYKDNLQLLDAEFNLGVKGGVTWLDKVDINVFTSMRNSKALNNNRGTDFKFGLETEIRLY